MTDLFPIVKPRIQHVHNICYKQMKMTAMLQIKLHKNQWIIPIMILKYKDKAPTIAIAAIIIIIITITIIIIQPPQAISTQAIKV